MVIGKYSPKNQIFLKNTHTPIFFSRLQKIALNCNAMQWSVEGTA